MPTQLRGSRQVKAVSVTDPEILTLSWPKITGTPTTLAGYGITDAIAGGAGVATRLAFWSGTSALSSNANLWWDNVRSRLSVNTATLLATFTVVQPADVTNLGGTTTANNVSAITGVGTTFTLLSLGDRISLSSAPTVYATVFSINSDTSLNVDAPLGNGTSQTFNVKRAIVRFDSNGGNSINSVRIVANDIGVGLNIQPIRGSSTSVGYSTAIGHGFGSQPSWTSFYALSGGQPVIDMFRYGVTDPWWRILADTSGARLVWNYNNGNGTRCIALDTTLYALKLVNNNATDSGTDALGGLFVAQLSGQYGSGTDIAGGHLIVTGGRGSGSGAAGEIRFQTSTPGATGTTIRALSTRATLQGSNFGIACTTPANLLSIGESGVTRGELNFAGTSGVLVLRGPATASGTLTLPAGTTDFSATGGTGQVVKQASTGAAFTVGTVSAADVATGFTLGSVVFAGTSGVLSQDNANFFWNNSTKTLQLGGDVWLTTNNRYLEGMSVDTLPVALIGLNALDKVSIAAGGHATVVGGTLSVVGTLQSTSTYGWMNGSQAGVARIEHAAGVFNPLNTSNNPAGVTMGALIATTGAFSGNVAVATTKFTVAASTGDTVIAGKAAVGTSTVHPNSQLLVGSTGECQLTLASDINNASSDTDVFLRFTIDAATTGTLKGLFGYDQGIDRFCMGYNGNYGFRLDSSGGVEMPAKFTKYNNITVAGWGSPAIYASARAVGQTAAVASVATYTVGAADGTFIVYANVLVTTSTTHSFAVNVTYTDEGNTARTLTLSLRKPDGVAPLVVANADGAIPYCAQPSTIRCKANTAITVKTTGTFTTVVYNVEGAIVQIA